MITVTLIGTIIVETSFPGGNALLSFKFYEQTSASLVHWIVNDSFIGYLNHVVIIGNKETKVIQFTLNLLNNGWFVLNYRLAGHTCYRMR